LIRKIARDVLEMNGFETFTAENGIDEVELYTKNKNSIACILLDVSMPQMSGQELYHLLKEIDTDAKIILSTGHGKS
jgi:two-component system, cell cycle sensor histidine kinase and response regulator CckA